MICNICCIRMSSYTVQKRSVVEMNERSEFSNQGSGTTFSVDQDGDRTWIFEVKGDGGEHSTFEEAKEFALFCLEETIENCQMRLEQLSVAETFEEYNSGYLTDGLSAAEFLKRR